MAGLTTTFHSLFKTQRNDPLTKTLSFFCLRSHIVSFPNATVRWGPLISTTKANTVFECRARRRSSMPCEDEALDISSVRSDIVRLIDEQQKMVGIVPKAQALQMAKDAELDLVILSLDADPPVLRIMDYPKYKYDQQKKKREQQKKASQVDLKVLKLGPRIEEHDFSRRLKAARKFLSDGDKVKVCVSVNKRMEKEYRDLEDELRQISIELIKRFREAIGKLAIEQEMSFKNKDMFVLLVPNKAVLQKALGTRPKEDQSPTVPEVSASG